jgi:hypothetical protein
MLTFFPESLEVPGGTDYPVLHECLELLGIGNQYSMHYNNTLIYFNTETQFPLSLMDGVWWPDGLIWHGYIKET